MKLSKSLLAMSILVGVLSAPIIFISPVRAVADVDILSHTGYLDSSGYYHVVGEVQNVGDQAVKLVKIEVTFYDSSNVVIATRFDLTMLYVLMVGRKSPFDIVLLDTTQSAKVDNYSLSVTFSATSPIPIGLEILSHNSYVDESGSMHIIVGEIMNIAAEKASTVRVIATYYDGAGDVVAAMLTYLDPIQSDLDPGQTAQFEFLLSDEDRTPYVDTYGLTAESTEYACDVVEPEFLPADLNKDGIVDIFDVVIVAGAFGSKSGDANWNPIADLVEDGIIDIFDVVIVAKAFGKTI